MAPDPTRPSEKKEIGQDTRQREVRRAARRQWSTHAGQLTTTSQRLEGKKQKRLKEKTHVILRTMSHRGSHALVQRLNREHVTEVFPLSSLIAHTPKTGLQPFRLGHLTPWCALHSDLRFVPSSSSVDNCMLWFLHSVLDQNSIVKFLPSIVFNL